MDNPKLAVLRQLGLLETGNTLSFEKREAVAEHEISDHNPVWAYCNPELANPFGENRRTMFAKIEPGTPLGEITSMTRVGVFIGATDTPLLRHYLTNPDCIPLVFEPDLNQLADFASTFAPHTLAAANCFLFGGDPNSLKEPLAHLLPKKLFDLGFPVTYVDPGLVKAAPDFVTKLTEQIEFIYFRYNIYPLSSSLYSRSCPMRNITTHLFYDQQKHFYGNIPRYTESLDPDAIANRFNGATALVVLAGPGLEDRMDFIRREREKCVLICVNSALIPLLKHGIEPDFAVISDNTITSGASLKQLGKLENTILVGHCLSDLDVDVFRRQCVYGNWKEELFGERADLLTHGSVLTTAYSLANHLGCRKMVTVAAIMSGTGPNRPMTYAKGTTQMNGTKPDTDNHLTNAYPQLYPATNSLGETMFTTLNFRDVVFWFLDEIRSHNMEVVNTNPSSILHGPGVTMNPDPREETSFPIKEAMEAILSMTLRKHDPEAIRVFVQQEIQRWQKVRLMAEAALTDCKNGSMGVAKNILTQFDADNVTYLVHRFEKFSNAHFCEQVFSSGAPKTQRAGLLYYFEHVDRMAHQFESILQQAATKLPAD